MEERISVLPDYTNTKMWDELCKQMIFGFNKHNKKAINFCTSSNVTKQSFQRMKEFSIKNIEFYETVKNLCIQELKMIEKEEMNHD